MSNSQTRSRQARYANRPTLNSGFNPHAGFHALQNVAVSAFFFLQLGLKLPVYQEAPGFRLGRKTLSNLRSQANQFH
ncbi:hypothetical protein FNV43_RR05687 [Rhamnella rubrinervis]|uniref:Uncharacterized protein n=1 Tax=Rhamnella rubrinervis TaxID=2594499 RepID=A0A8K0MRC3_9ROSA|nr:hypothetical protein FNV43_RR05687 [Rhamnella rubrinervis]